MITKIKWNKRVYIYKLMRVGKTKTTENKLKNLLELKKQVETDYRNATKEQIRILKEYSWAIGEMKIKE